MSIFVDATAAPAPKTKNTVIVATFLALLLVVMAVGQLYGFEKFIPLIEGFGLPGGETGATLVAAFIVISEVFALPFLLRMRLSPLMRIISMVLGWMAAAIWTYLAVWVLASGNGVENVGIFGTSIELPMGLWTVFYGLALGVLAAWAAWGLWPIAVAKHK